MNNTVPINSKKFLGNYSEAQNSERIPDEALFFTGVIFSAVLPQIIFGTFSRFIPFAIFAGCALVGSIMGLIMHYLFPYQVPSCVEYGDVPQTPLREDAKKKAA